jgi:uncharacterized protein (TIGR00369 family)
MSFRPANPDFQARVRDSFARQAFMGAIGAELTRVEPGATTIRLPWRADLTQQHGFFHGGIVGTLADNAGGYAAFSLLPADHSVLTVEFKVNLLSPARGEGLESDSRVMRAGRTLLVCLSEVFALRDGGRHLCATGLVTLMGLAGRDDH